ATGSLHELETQLIISFEIQLVNEENFQKIMSKIDELKRMLYVFKSKFISKKTTPLKQ
ncbi:MAG: four helix bundle protein, partial [Bacteroidia bacterium]